ncbi:MAG: glycosyltransferase family 87 protein [Vulcanimicrobiaceae bacterium]
MLLFVAFFIVRPTGNTGMAMRDFEAFYSAGVVANRGGDPYGRAIWGAERDIPGIDTSHDETLPFVGPSAGIPLWRAVARLPYDVAGRLWGAILALALLTIVFGSASLAGAPQRASVLLGIAVFSAAYGPLISDVALGQVALLAAAGIVGALVLLRTRLVFAAGVSAAIGALQPSLILPLIARATDARALAAFAFGAVLFGTLTLANGGFAGVWSYLHLLSIHGASEAATVIQITPQGIARGFGAPPAVLVALRFGSAGLAIALTLLAARQLRDPTLRTGIASCALLFVIPFVHEHDFVLLVLPALCCAVRARGTTLAFASIVATAAGVDWLGLAQRPNGGLQTVVLSVACALGFALVAGLQRESWAGLCVPLAVVMVAIVARTHPAPVWPDSLPLHWQPPLDASVSDVWALEQQAGGLDATDPVWSLLRSLTLFATALLGVATWLTGKQQQRAPEDTRRNERLGVRGLARELLPEGAGPP